MHERTVEERALRQIEVGDGVPMIEALNIRPVLLSCGRLRIGQCRQFHLTLERLGEYLVEVALLAVDDGAIREGDADKRRLRTGSWNVSKRGTAIEQARPFAWVLGACNLSVGTVHERVSAISQQPAFVNFGCIQLLAQHGFDGVSPERNDRTQN